MTNESPGKPNAELAYRVLDHIDAHPETWDQSLWDCGTTACFAGWAVRLSGCVTDRAWVIDGPTELVGKHVQNAAYVVLDIDDFDAVVHANGVHGWLFGSENGRAVLGRLVEAIFGPRPGSAS